MLLQVLVQGLQLVLEARAVLVSNWQEKKGKDLGNQVYPSKRKRQDAC